MQRIEIVGFHQREGRNGPVDFVTFALPGNAKEATTVMRVSECAEKVPDYAEQIAQAHGKWKAEHIAPPLPEQEAAAEPIAEAPKGDAA